MDHNLQQVIIVAVLIHQATQVPEDVIVFLLSRWLRPLLGCVQRKPIRICTLLVGRQVRWRWRSIGLSAGHPLRIGLIRATRLTLFGNELQSLFLWSEQANPWYHLPKHSLVEPLFRHEPFFCDFQCLLSAILATVVVKRHDLRVLVAVWLANTASKVRIHDRLLADFI